MASRRRQLRGSVARLGQWPLLVGMVFLVFSCFGGDEAREDGLAMRGSNDASVTDWRKGTRVGEAKTPGPTRRHVDEVIRLETFNGSCWSTLWDRNTRATADVRFVQEHRLHTQEGYAAASATAFRAGLKLAGGISLTTEK
eukprot:11011977-Karenia_brevis.AAC.1